MLKIEDTKTGDTIKIRDKIFTSIPSFVIAISDGQYGYYKIFLTTQETHIANKTSFKYMFEAHYEYHPPDNKQKIMTAKVILTERIKYYEH